MDDIFAYTPSPDTTPENGPLRGLTAGIQPCFSVAGWPTDAGSRALAGYVALEDATAVERLRRSGVVLCGLTRSSEFGFGLDGGRMGRAVEQGAVEMELALDLMGESRLAAALARVCAFKPSWGLVSRYGLIGLIPSMEGCALLSRDTIRIREALTVLAGPDERDISLPDEGGADFCPAAIHPEETILGYIREVQEALAPEVREAFDKDLADLQGAGFPVKSLSFPEFPLFSLVHGIVGAVEASSSAGRYDSVRYGQRTPGARNWNDMYLQSRGGAFGTLLKGYLFQGAYFQFEAYDAYEDACRIRARLVKAMEGLLNQAAFLVFPAINPAASPQAASPADLYDRFRFTLFANVTGQPALYLPSSGGGGAPGLQWVGARRSDAGLLDLGDFLLRLRQGGV